MAPSIAARRVDGVQGARCPKAAPRGQRCLSREPVLSKAICRPTRSTEGTGGLAAPRIRSATYILARRCDHPVFQTETSALLRAGQLVDAPSVIARRVPRRVKLLCGDAAARALTSSPHKKSQAAQNAQGR